MSNPYRTLTAEEVVVDLPFGILTIEHVQHVQISGELPSAECPHFFGPQVDLIEGRQALARRRRARH